MSRQIYYSKQQQNLPINSLLPHKKSSTRPAFQRKYLVLFKYVHNNTHMYTNIRTNIRAKVELMISEIKGYNQKFNCTFLSIWSAHFLEHTCWQTLGLVLLLHNRFRFSFYDLDHSLSLDRSTIINRRQGRESGRQG